MICDALDSILKRLQRKKPTQLKEKPTVHKGLEPTLSDSQPETGDKEENSTAGIAIYNPAVEEE